MGSASVVDSARQSLGPVGAYLPIPFASAPPVVLQREAAGRLERAGYQTVWTNETVGGRDPLVQVALLLPATEQMTFGTGIANIWARVMPSGTAHLDLIAGIAQLEHLAPAVLQPRITTARPMGSAGTQ